MRFAISVSSLMTLMTKYFYFLVNMNATEEEVEELISTKQTNIFVGNVS